MSAPMLYRQPTALCCHRARLVAFIRVVSTASSNPVTAPHRVAIIGAGPSGFYVGHRLLEKHQATTQGLRIDFFEKLPAPYGLSRYGVAPDHPEVKNCQDTFDAVLKNPNVRFYGNVEVSDRSGSEDPSTVTIEALRARYHAVVFAYGCSEDNTLGIEGERHPGVISARQFVGWYNGLPEFQSLNPPLERTENVVIVGNGNVALDVARILLACPTTHWASTDITSTSNQVLASSKVKRVSIVARRGYYESAFTNKEFRELLDLSTASKQQGAPQVTFSGIDESLIASMAALLPLMGRVHKRRLDMYRKYQKEEETYVARHGKYHTPKQWALKYLLTPLKVVAHSSDPTLVLSMICTRNVLSVPSSMDEPVEVTATDETRTLKADLVITSIGYKGSPLPGFKQNAIAFDHHRGVIKSRNGRVLEANTNPNKKLDVITGLYTSGWIKNGAKGVIASTMLDAFEVGDTLLHDLALGCLDKAVENELHLPRAVSAEAWFRVDQMERAQGISLGKPREKIGLVREMIQVANP